jgi:hypothetical protein
MVPDVPCPVSPSRAGNKSCSEHGLSGRPSRQARALAKGPLHAPQCSAYGLRCDRFFETQRRRSALLRTNTDDMAIAAAASIGDNWTPQTGYKSPAATGINAAL